MGDFIQNDSEYIYRTISRLTTHNLCNCYFFIIKTDTPRPKQEKYFSTIFGADNDKEMLKCSLFFSINHLDLVESLAVGNIVRVQRLNVTSVPRDDQPKIILSKVDFDQVRNPPLNFTVFSSAVNSGYQPILSLNQHYSLSKSDKEIIDKMRSEWLGLKRFWENHFKNISVPNHSCTPLENLKANQYVSIVAKVIDKQITISNLKKATLTLWDGTGDDLTFGGGGGGGGGGTRGFNGDDTAPLMGSTIPCNTWSEDLIKYIEDSIEIGNWVYIYGARTNIYHELLETKLSKASAIKILPENSPQVESILKNYKAKIKQYVGNNSLIDGINSNSGDIDSSDDVRGSKRQRLNDDGVEEEEDEEYINLNENTKITDTPYPHIPITTIENVKLSDQVPNKFKIHVSLVQHIPLNILDFTRVLCKQCGKTSEYRDENVNPNLITCLHCGSGVCEFIFLFKLIVKDQTDELPVIFYYHANSFLNILPTNLYTDKKSLGEIEGKMSFLKKPRVSFDLCIQSYYEDGKDRLPENIKYQAFDTKLLIKLLNK